MNSDIQHRIVQLFKQWAGSEPATVIPIAGSGSSRKYFRLNNGSQTAIGVYHTDEAENSAFIEFSKHFRKHELAVPEIYAKNLDHHVYLLQDLGDTSLFSLVEEANNSGGLTENVIDLYKRSLEQLVRFQVIAGKDLDYSFCYPRASFDKQSIFWDLNHFKYYFLKLTGINFDEQKLEDDFHTLTDYLLQADGQFFMFRDFQSRNIMILNNSPYFIDYQGGRRGALQYDLASLLFQAKAKLPFDVRDQLLNYYMDKLEDYIHVDHKEFIRFYHGYILIRVIQVLGTYGYRGLYENKSHFIQSIPYALKNLEWLLANISLPVDLPELWPALQQILRNEDQFTHFDDRQGLKV
ncbi:MAG: phosphotransferase, partial [Bacteroidales bacterium]|nr:phosphotransferase [Bacteroidales bacterium]